MNKAVPPRDASGRKPRDRGGRIQMKLPSARGQRCSKLWPWKVQGGSLGQFCHGAQHMASGSSGDDQLAVWAWGWDGLVTSLQPFTALPGDKGLETIACIGKRFAFVKKWVHFF